MRFKPEKALWRDAALPLPYELVQVTFKQLHAALVDKAGLPDEATFSGLRPAKEGKDPLSERLIRLPAWQELRTTLKRANLETEWKSIAGAAVGGSPGLLDDIARVLSVYKEDARSWERLADWIERIGWPRFFEKTGLTFTKYLIDDVIIKKHSDHLALIVGAVALAGVVQTLCGFALNQIFARSTNRLIVELRCKVYSHVVRLPLLYHDSTKSGTLGSRIMNDVSGLQNLVGVGLLNFVGTLMTAALALAVVAIDVTTGSPAASSPPSSQRTAPPLRRRRHQRHRL